MRSIYENFQDKFSLVENLSMCNFIHCNLNYNWNCPLQLKLQVELSFATCPLGIDSTK